MLVIWRQAAAGSYSTGPCFLPGKDRSRDQSSCDRRWRLADPTRPRQRGSNENTTGLLRQYFPKGTSIAAFTQEQLDEIAAKLNGRPRQTLNWMTPSEKLHEVLR